MGRSVVYGLKQGLTHKGWNFINDLKLIKFDDLKVEFEPLYFCTAGYQEFEKQTEILFNRLNFLGNH